MRIIIFGPPGAGKGTQAKKIANYYNIEHLSTGNLFRNAIRDETDLGKSIKSIMDSGNLVPDQIVVDLVEDTINNREFDKGYIIDGFPRTVSQAVAFDTLLAQRNESLDVFLSLKVSDEELIQRILSRNEGRSDDTEEKIKTRLAVYKQQTAPVLEYYLSSPVFHTVDGSGTIDEIFNRILSELPNRGS